MKLYRIPIQLESALATPLKGDTIWGHIVWGIANHEGEDAVRQFLDTCKNGEPPLVVSSAFPAGFVCKHMMPPPERDELLSPDKYAQIKLYKKQKYEKAEAYVNFKSAPKIEGEGKSAFEEIRRMHNSIDRFSNTVQEDGGLFASKEIWPKQKYFDVYVSSSYEPARIKELFDWAFENGFGADASTGKGKISVCGLVEEVSAKKSGKKYMALAPFVLPADGGGISDLRADIFIRTGRIGGAFVAELSPYKKTVVLYDEGAVFESEAPLLYVGNLIPDVHSDKRICQAGFAPVLPIGE